MKKFLYPIFVLAISIFLSNHPFCAAQTLEGGVSFSVDSAREYVQEAQSDNIEINGPFELQSDNTQKVVYSYNPRGEVIGITVQYINEPKKAYIYNKNGQLIYVDKYDKSVDKYPHRGYRYNLDGKLILTTLTVSTKEQYRFSPDGKLIAHAINGIIYDENGKIIGNAK